MEKNQCANATEFNLVSNIHHSPKKRHKNNNAKKDTSLNLGMVGNGIMELGKITMERNIGNWEDKLYDMGDKLMDLELDCDILSHTTNTMKKKISNLEGKIKNKKKSCAGL